MRQNAWCDKQGNHVAKVAVCHKGTFLIHGAQTCTQTQASLYQIVAENMLPISFSKLPTFLLSEASFLDKPSLFLGLVINKMWYFTQYFNAFSSIKLHAAATFNKRHFPELETCCLWIARLVCQPAPRRSLYLCYLIKYRDSIRWWDANF